LYSRLASIVLVFFLTGCATSNITLPYQTKEKLDYSQMYLRGIMNWWEISEPYKLQAIEPDVYALTIELIADGQPYDFKIADAGWSDAFNCGTEFGEQLIGLDKTKALYCAADSANLKFTPSKTARYKLIFDTSDNDEPELRITQVD